MAKYEKKIKEALLEKYPDARIEIERSYGSNPIFTVITGVFENKPEKKRQDEIWAWLKEKLDFEDIRHIGFILTMTPEEEKAYAE